MKRIKERIADLTAFKEEVGRNEMICNKVHKVISLWKEYLENMIKRTKKTVQVEKLLLLVEI